MNDEDINDYIPSVLNPRFVRKPNCNLSLTQSSFVSRSSLSLRRNHNGRLKLEPKRQSKLPPQVNKENFQNPSNLIRSAAPKLPKVIKSIDKDSLSFSAIADLLPVDDKLDDVPFTEVVDVEQDKEPVDCVAIEKREPLKSVSSNTELYGSDTSSISTVINNVSVKPTISVSFGVKQCDNLNINSKNSNIKSIKFSHKNDHTLVDCEIIETSKASSVSDLDENMNEFDELLTPNSLKRSAVTVNLEIKKKKPSTETVENSKVLILNTSAVEKISHVIVQPPNYKLVQKNISEQSQIKSVTKEISLRSNFNNGVVHGRLRQKSIDSFFNKPPKVLEENNLGASALGKVWAVNNGDKGEMSRISGTAEKSGHKSPSFLSKRADNDTSNGPVRASSSKKGGSPRPETSCSTPGGRNDSTGSHTPRRNVDSLQFSIPTKTVSGKKPSSAKAIPYHKIVFGTHFAVDAFSYGEIQNVKHYFLTHFHSDHYSGLKKGFKKLLFCSKITADLCTSRLGVNSKCIHVLKIDETIRIDDVEVTAVEANHGSSHPDNLSVRIWRRPGDRERQKNCHWDLRILSPTLLQGALLTMRHNDYNDCPGAIMLVFTLPNGKTLLHTGDFRASPVMESYPIFWNKDIHTIYLDTTYCNPRYDFPTQEQSLEMALYILRQKKLSLEQVGKKFSSVLIVCGTYTIGKEKFFLGMSRRVGCAVWACPEKARVLHAVEGRSFGHAAPHSCQLHVVPMRDLTHETLRAYLDSLKGAFSEVVAFKPSGWENTKTASVKKDLVTIHGIPYSEHSSFSELIRFVKFLKPKQVVPTVDISGGVSSVQKYFPCPLFKEENRCQKKVSDFFSIQNQQQVPAVT